MATVIGSFIKRRDFFHGFVSLPEGNIVAYEMYIYIYISVMAYDLEHLAELR